MDNHFEITVKNTFVHLSVFPSVSSAAAAERRCRSVPSSARLLILGCDEKKASTDHAPTNENTHSESSEAASRWSDVSTSADSLSDFESVGSSPQHRVTSAATSSASTSPTKVAATGAVQRPVGKEPQRAPANSRARTCRGEESTGVSRSSAFGGHRRMGTKASTSAASAVISAAPAATAVAAAPAALAPGELLRQLTVIVAAAAAALADCSHIKSAKTTEGPRGWSIVAKIAAEDAHHKEAALDVAREALLQAARHSNCVYVLGHRAQPFLSTPVGFASSIGAVADESKACWSMINQGFCRKGCACRWDHPACQTTVNVMVQVERPSP
mmetsp:Transcript_114460/g.296542  ORF Transcript_114460/g.296542 Transcript_114460/m.296542 type:complete len:329 (+) Transcript_114460:161-1147(+)